MGDDGYLNESDVDWSATGFSCTGCGEAIDYQEEVFVLTVALAHQGERGIEYAPLIFEDGDFLYEPHFLCFNCRDDELEELCDLMRDVPPVLDQHASFECDACRSGVRSGEVVAIMTHGEVRLSKRSPNGENGGSTFECMDSHPDVLCICCINRLSKDVIDELWSEEVRQYNECREGTQIRCWRSGCSADMNSDCTNCKKQVG
jgi:hypothetical protein